MDFERRLAEIPTNTDSTKALPVPILCLQQGSGSIQSMPQISVSGNYGQSLTVTLPISKSLTAGSLGFESITANWIWEAAVVLKR
jgi:hypothetical protein